MKKIALLLCFLSTSTLAFDNGQYQNVDPKIRDWFRSVRSPKGVPCCDLADGHATTWRKSQTTGHQYDAIIEGDWVAVPDESIVKNANNPTGETIIWYVRQYYNGTPADLYIRCFVLGSGS